MFQRVHKWFKKIRKQQSRYFYGDDRMGPEDSFSSKRNPPRHIAGQVGLILILAAAIGLILYAATINIGKISSGKTLTIIGANTAASKMASFIASYGQMLYMTSLGGKTKICAWTGFLVKLIAAIIVIVLVVVCAATGQIEGWGLAAAIVAAVLVIAAAVIDVTVTQPGITSMWNKMMSDSLTTKEMAIEYGIQTALMSAVTDPAQIPDLFDMDTDTAFGDLSDPLDRTTAPDYVSRFAYYYTRRLQGIQDNNSNVVEQFLDSLGDFLYGGDNSYDTDNWGLFDPLDCEGNPTHPCCPISPTTDNRFPSMCDPCCVDSAFRPACCATGSCIADEGFTGGDPNTCYNRSPFHDPLPPVAPNLAVSYPYVYQGFYEDSTNNSTGQEFISFREWIGEDDTHHQYEVNSARPQWHLLIDGSGTVADHSQLLRPQAEYDFYMEDATGFYSTDDRLGIFPFFYKLDDWGMNLQELTYGALALPNRDDLECHLCDPTGLPPTGDVPVECTGLTFPAEISPALILPNTPDDAPYSGGWCVDATNMGSDFTDPPQLLDLVPNIDDILAEDSECAQDEGGWKRGADLFCDPPDEWPYMAECVKAGNGVNCTEVDPEDGTVYGVDCNCGEGGALDPYPPVAPAAGTNWQYVWSNWPDDKLDDFIYGLTEFYSWAMEQYKLDPDEIEDNFIDWYEIGLAATGSGGFADWFEAPCPGGDPSACGSSCTGNEDGGYWYVWRDDLNSFYQPIVEWMEPTVPYVGSGCKIDSSAATPAVWCVPPPQGAANKYADPAYVGFQAGYDGLECPGVSQEEQAVFDFNGNGTRGDLEDIIACLDWNLADLAQDASGNAIISGATGAQAQGNAEKFDACKWDCDNDIAASISSCQVLPRSLVPGFDEMTYTVAGDPNDLLELDECYGTTNIYTCNIECAVLPGGYGIPAFTATDDTPDPPAVPPDDNVLTKINNMYDFCIANPTGTLTNQCRDQSTTINCASATIESELLNCSCTWAGVGVLGTCEETCGYGATPFFDAVGTALENSVGSCGDTDPGGWKDLLDWSVLAAQNQAAKIEKRVNLLTGRRDEAEEITNQLFNGLLQINNFLTGPAQAVIDACKSWDNLYPPATTSFAIYAWQDEPKDVYNTIRGDWHVVKVTVRSPGRCNGACGTDRWPWIKTWTKDWGTKRCYELQERTGRVKAMVIRYDEDSVSGNINFANGTRLWKPMFYHPEGQDNDPTDLELTCSIMIDPNIAGTSWEWGWKNAFMINRTPTASAGYPRGDAQYKDCWDFIHESLLRYGYVTTSCAQYYLGGGGGGYSGLQSFRIRFYQCDDQFIAGTN